MCCKLVVDFFFPVVMLPKGSRVLQNTSHDFHLGAAVAEPLQEIQILNEEAAVHPDKNLIHHKRRHDAKRTELLFREHARVHVLQIKWNA